MGLTHCYKTAVFYILFSSKIETYNQGCIRASAGPSAVAKMRAPYKLLIDAFCISLERLHNIVTVWKTNDYCNRLVGRYLTAWN